jgi:4a-hydroxytetrahydrobiopterin dehydratase
MTHYTHETVFDALGDCAVRWKWKANALYAEFCFSDFATAFAFMTKVAEVAEKMNHHPDWKNSYNRIAISLINHDQYAVTELYVSLSKEISELAQALR